MRLFFQAIIAVLLLGDGVLFAADTAAKIPAKVVTTLDLRELLLHTKWSWKNVSAGVPDRECVFMADGTFHHPHFVATFTIKDLHVVELAAKGKHAVLTFNQNYTTFEAIDFEKHGISGKRLQEAR
jgi:hypothetical protein